MGSILLLGVSGLVPITVYLRVSTLDDTLKQLNVSIARGVFEEHDKITQLSLQHDVVINAATSTDLPLTEAILKGLKEKRGTLIHLSGAGNFLDGGRNGEFAVNGKVWNDEDEGDVKSISSKIQPNGACDEAILKAGAAGEVNAFFVPPGGVYGQSKDAIGSSSAGVFTTWMIGNVTQLGYSPYIGEGSSVFQVVHVDDVVSLMLLVYNKAISIEPGDSVYGHYYMALGKQVDWKSLAGAFAKLRGLPVKQVSFEEAGFLNALIGSNLLAKNQNALSLGWKPQHTSIVMTLAS